ncbi:hypothetical protein HMPREF9552_03345 [Escherichia coli MS 198-1]|nr:hypothetical protein HMPREF9552_03345 [Escherichia coli MS 198-1]
MRNGSEYRKNRFERFYLSLISALLIHLINILALNTIIPFYFSVS